MKSYKKETKQAGYDPLEAQWENKKSLIKKAPFGNPK